MSGRVEKLAYRVPEAVEASGIGRTKLYELIANKRLATVKIGGRTLIPRASLEALVSPQAEAA